MTLDLGKIQVLIGGDAEELKRVLGEVKRNMKDVGDELKDAGQTLSLAVTAPLLAIGGAATKMAMDAVESENLFEVAMGDMAQAAREWSEQLSESLGLNAFEIRKTTGTLFTMLESMGLGRDAAFDMAKSLVMLSYDMASFRNLKPEEAFEKLRAGIVGETEPLKALGVLVDENTIKTVAYTKGIAQQGAELTQQQKVLARFAAIMQQTKKDQGDLARTIESPTNQLRIMREQVKQASQEFGMALLPAVTEVIRASKPLVQGLRDAVKWFAGLNKETKSTILTVLGVAAAAGPVLFVLGGMISGIGNLVGAVKILGTAFRFLATNPMGLVIAAISALILAGVYIIRNWDTVKSAALNAWGRIKEFISDAAAAAVEAWASFIGWFNKAKAEQLRQTAANLRTQADMERATVEERIELAEQEERAKALAKFREVDAALEAEEAQKEAAREGSQFEIDSWLATVDAAGQATEEKKDFLDDFKVAWRRAQEEALTDFKRRQEDATDEYRRQQEERLRQFRDGQERERRTFERGLEDRKVAFERALEDEQIDFERALEDRKAAFLRELDAEKDAFIRTQRDQLDAFKRRQQEELDALRARQDAELAAVDATFAARIAELRQQQEAIRKDEEEEERQRRLAELAERVAKAREEVAKAREKGDPEQVAKAEERLNDALDEQQRFHLREQRRREQERLQNAIDTLRRERDERLRALRQQQEDERKSFQDRQAEELVQRQQELDAEKVAFEERLAERRVQFERELADEKEAFLRAQEDRERRFGEQLDAERKAFQDRQAAALEHFKEQQSLEQREWKRLQEDRERRFKQELEDLETSFKDKLGAQRRFIADWNAGVNQLRRAVPADASGAPAVNSQSSEVPAPVPKDNSAGTSPPTDQEILDMDYEDQLKALFPGAVFNDAIRDAAETLNETTKQHIRALADSVSWVTNPVQASPGPATAATAAIGGGGGTVINNNIKVDGVPIREFDEREMTRQLQRLELLHGISII